MDYAATDRAMSRYVVRLERAGQTFPMWIADNQSESATDIPERRKIYRDATDARMSIFRLCDEWPSFRLWAEPAA